LAAPPEPVEPPPPEKPAAPPVATEPPPVVTEPAPVEVATPPDPVAVPSEPTVPAPADVPPLPVVVEALSLPPIPEARSASVSSDEQFRENAARNTKDQKRISLILMRVETFFGSQMWMAFRPPSRRVQRRWPRHNIDRHRWFFDDEA